MLTQTTYAAKPSINAQSSERAQLSYSFGYLIGKSNVNTLKQLDYDLFMEGFKGGYTGQPAALSNEQMLSVINRYKKSIESQALTELNQKSAENLKLGQNFLQKNAQSSQVKVTATGLQYQILNEGQGKQPNVNSEVKVNYEGRLIDGTVFDSSIARDEPITFKLNQVIKGWQEGLMLMHEGSRYRFFIPAHLAYGEIGAGEAVPPNSALIFDVELLKVQ